MNTFIKLENKILSSKLNIYEKVIVSIVLSFQNDNKKCTKSNPTLAKELSISECTLGRLITKLNKFEWFSSRNTADYNENGKWINSKEMTIDEDLFNNYLDVINNEPKKEKIKANKAIVEVVKQQVEPEPIQEEEVPLFDNIIIGKPKTEDEYELPSEEEYNAIPKNKVGDISYSQFHQLTKNKFSKSHPFFVPDGRNYKDFINTCKELNNEINEEQLH